MTGKTHTLRSTLLTTDLLLPLRLVAGWTYFSAFWRRLILADKLNPDVAGYVGDKFNHFLPNALFIKPIIEYFVTHPEHLLIKLWIFTIVEAVVGLALILGFMTRLMGLIMSLLALGILLGAGWLGTTCLDEWQIGVLGIAAGFAFVFAGGGRFSLDYLLETRRSSFVQHPVWSWFNFDWLQGRRQTIAILTASVFAFSLTLFTNQVFHGGVWGTLHNKSVRPVVEVSHAQILPEGLEFTAYRVEGADVYGSFLIGVRILNAAGEAQLAWSAEDLASLPAESISNRYVSQIKSGAHSLILPLGAKADIRLQHPDLRMLAAGDYHVELLDISGATWSAPITLSTE
ncbi:TQO small subunit DoxD [Coraliomargarita sp. SDUM461003]|uniref:TQO small subunit DoxD n=1 Tax=Thalassobacterium maritimum TaxID=3041265 RepID=A0ABU1AZS2_9BACT|nr:TQO small subunit DoxD [Coraliomargarita sp. SDUM461003]MDQ8209622.1 TQO small subunit DoxD [Coraliomargarita sp. SDUM461003]